MAPGGGAAVTVTVTTQSRYGGPGRPGAADGRSLFGRLRPRTRRLRKVTSLPLSLWPRRSRPQRPSQWAPVSHSMGPGPGPLPAGALHRTVFQIFRAWQETKTLRPGGPGSQASGDRRRTRRVGAAAVQGRRVTARAARSEARDREVAAGPAIPAVAVHWDGGSGERIGRGAARS